MTKSAMIALALAAGVGLGACSVEEDGGSPTDVVPETGTAQQSPATEAPADGGTATTGTPAGDDTATTSAAGSYAEGACTEFFTAGGPLAERAEETRAMLEGGEVTDTVTLDQVSLLQSRIAMTAEDADPDVAALLEQVNAPFTQAVELMNEGEVVDAESGEVTLPEIDVEGSAQAQTELGTACAA